MNSDTLAGFPKLSEHVVRIVPAAAVLAVVVPAVRLRRAPEFGLATAAAVSLLVSLALWGFVVSPVNADWAAGYELLRACWAFGHVAA